MDCFLQPLDPSRFLSDTSTVERLLCPICLNVLTDPVTTPCEHLFCGTCIRQSLLCGPPQSPARCPTCAHCPLTAQELRPAHRFILNVHRELHIECDFKTLGCDAVLTLEQLPSHRLVCDFAPCYCSNFRCEFSEGCGTEEESAFRNLSGSTTKQEPLDVRFHQTFADTNVVVRTSTNESSGNQLQRITRSRSIDSVPERRPLMLLRKDMAAHVERCAWRMVACPASGVASPASLTSSPGKAVPLPDTSLSSSVARKFGALLLCHDALLRAGRTSPLGMSEHACAMPIELWSTFRGREFIRRRWTRRN